MIALRALAPFTDQWTHTIWLNADGIQRIKTGNLAVELGFGALVEALEGLLGAVVPIAVYLS